jgi:gamma-glutamyltranspeptidase
VSELALGAMTFGTKEWGVEREESRRVYDKFREAGGQIIRRDPDGVLWGGSDPRADGCAMAL